MTQYFTVDSFEELPLIKRKLYWVWLASWYPSKTSPTNGDFIQRHAISVAKHHDLLCLHSIHDPNSAKKQYYTFREKGIPRIKEDEIYNVTEKGDIIVTISYKPSKNFIRTNDYDIIFKKEIKWTEVYHELKYEIIMPNGRVIFIHAQSLIGNNDLVQKIEKNGIPYEDEDGNKEGTLYIQYRILFPLDKQDFIKEISDEKIEDISSDANKKYHKAVNCSINELFM
jgi:DnaJ-class molecular chaperone